MNHDEIQSIIDVVKSCDDVVLGTNRLDGYPECRTVMNALNADINDLSSAIRPNIIEMNPTDTDSQETWD